MQTIARAVCDGFDVDVLDENGNRLTILHSDEEQPDWQVWAAPFLEVSDGDTNANG